MRHLLALSLFALLASACSRSSAPAQQQQQQTGDAQAGAAAPSGAATEAPAPKSPTAYVTTVSVLKREPSDAAKIPGKPGSKDVSNFVDLLYRGEKVAVLETRDEWVRVRSSGEKEGWMKRTSTLEGDALQEATVLAPTDVFDRPDLLAANAKRKLDPGTFVLVVKEKKPFSEVNYSGSQDVWVLTERLNTSEKEVMVSRLAEKIRYLWRNNKKDEALANFGIAKQVAEGSVLIDVLAQELGLAPAEGGEPPTTAPPAGGPTGSDPLQPGAAAEQ
jgi:hypothetical protein